MERLKDFDLPWYIKDDLICLLEKYPNLLTMTEPQLKAVSRDLWFDAQYHTEKACLRENEAGVIDKFCKAKYGGTLNNGNSNSY